MIIKSSQRAGHRQLAAHLIKSRDEDGEAQEVRISNYRNLMSAQSVHAALMDMEMMAWASPRTKKDLYHISMSPSEELTEADWEKAWEIYETEFGLEEHPFIEVTHDKKGRVHQHRVYERVDTETERSIKLSFTKIRNELVARQLEYEFGHDLTVGKHNRTVMLKLAEQGKDDVVAWLEQSKAHAVDRPVAKDDYSELQQERRTKIKKADVKAALQEAYAKTDTGAGFEAAIAEHNLLLCHGDRRDFVVVDAQGGTHSPRRLIGVKTAELRECWSDLDPKSLLSVQEAKAAREAQWALLQQEQAAAAEAAVREEMTATEQREEQQLLQEINALQLQFYEEFQQESLGAEIHSGTRQLGILPHNFEQWQAQHELVGQGTTQLRQYGAGTSGGENGSGHFDQRQLIEQFNHWQTIAEADSERRSPQADLHGVTHGDGTSGSTDDDLSTRPDGPSSSQSYRPVEPVTAWGLSPSLLLLLQTYTGNAAIIERERRIDAALAVPGDENLAVEPPGSHPGEASERSRDQHKRDVSREAETNDQPADAPSASKKEASAAYLKELGQYLRQRGRGAYNQADRWLAERLAKRGYTRQETRRVIAQSSPELMEQAPGQRVGYIRQITERVYRRREQWQERLAAKENKKVLKQQGKTLSTGKATSRTVVVPKAAENPIIKTTKGAPKPSSSVKKREPVQKQLQERDIEPEL